MAGKLITLDVQTRAEWRRWLEKHHASSPGIWLLRHKKGTGVKSMSYEELVCEALCFGWVDSLIKRLDDNRYAIKVTPRQPTSNWSDSNRKRWKELKAAGLLAATGLMAAPTANRYAPKPKIPERPLYIVTAFTSHSKAWRFFQGLSARNRRDFVVWIHTAKRSETRERRIRRSIELLSAGTPGQSRAADAAIARICAAAASMGPATSASSSAVDTGGSSIEIIPFPLTGEVPQS